MKATSMVTSLAILSLYALALTTLVEGLSSADCAGASEPISSLHHCTSKKTCRFYSDCAEHAFHCGTQGFAISYAKKRCSNIIKIRPHRSAASRWAQATEECFQNKMDDLLQDMVGKVHPDPQTCLAWETQAMEALNDCYTQNADAFFNLSQDDMRRIIGALRISDYYNPAVDAGLVRFLSSRQPELAAELAHDHSLSSHRRILMCVKATSYHENRELIPSPEEFVRVLRDELMAAEGDILHYAGPDQQVGLCHESAKKHPTINDYKRDYHLVSWFTRNYNRSNVPARNIMYRNGGLRVDGVMFELTTRDTREVTQCGDGIRQVSEACDFSGAYPGCTIDCQVKEGYDCTVEKLHPSTCWREVCGDGLRTRGEECDDGDSLPSSGCDELCRINTTFTCTQRYNSTSRCTPLEPCNTEIHLQQAPPAKLTVQSARQQQPVPAADRTAQSLSAVSAGSRVAAALPISSVLSMALLCAAWAGLR